MDLLLSSDESPNNQKAVQFIVPRAVVKKPAGDVPDFDESKAERPLDTDHIINRVAQWQKTADARVQLQQYKEDLLVAFSASFARLYGVSDAIVYHHLQEQQRAVPEYRERHQGKLWIEGYSHQRIFDALQCFEYPRQVSDAVARLEANGLIETEKTGAFVQEGRIVGKKCQVATWFHVPNTSFATDITSFQEADARRLDIPKALILARYDEQPITKRDGEGRGCRKLSAIELEKELPFNKGTLGKHLREMVVNRVFIPHEKHPKCYRKAN